MGPVQVEISPEEGRALCVAAGEFWPQEVGGRHWLPQLFPAGSPERTVQRAVLGGDDGRRWVVEGSAMQKMAARQCQAETLQELSRRGVPHLLPWQKTSGGDWGRVWGGLYWQMRRWADSLELPRDAYGRQAWRGEAAAAFLTALRRAGEVPPAVSRQPFALFPYIDRLLLLIRADQPALHADLLPLRRELEPFRRATAELPAGFCHGDFHPGNLLWGEQTVLAVIDWEFMGYKPEGYDAANFLGCAGMDEPEFLTGALSAGFLRGLHQGGVLSPASWEWLPEMLAALRFAWMREWWWKKLPKMMVQELDFIWLILDNREFLRRRWCELRERTADSSAGGSPEGA